MDSAQTVEASRRGLTDIRRLTRKTNYVKMLCYNAGLPESYESFLEATVRELQNFCEELLEERECAAKMERSGDMETCDNEGVADNEGKQPRPGTALSLYKQDFTLPVELSLCSDHFKELQRCPSCSCKDNSREAKQHETAGGLSSQVDTRSREEEDSVAKEEHDSGSWHTIPINSSSSETPSFDSFEEPNEFLGNYTSEETIGEPITQLFDIISKRASCAKISTTEFIEMKVVEEQKPPNDENKMGQAESASLAEQHATELCSPTIIACKNDDTSEESRRIPAENLPFAEKNMSILKQEPSCAGDESETSTTVDEFSSDEECLEDVLVSVSSEEEVTRYKWAGQIFEAASSKSFSNCQQNPSSSCSQQKQANRDTDVFRSRKQKLQTPCADPHEEKCFQKSEGRAEAHQSTVSCNNADSKTRIDTEPVTRTASPLLSKTPMFSKAALPPIQPQLTAINSSLVSKGRGPVPSKLHCIICDDRNKHDREKASKPKTPPREQNDPRIYRLHFFVSNMGRWVRTRIRLGLAKLRRPFG